MNKVRKYALAIGAVLASVGAAVAQQSTELATAATGLVTEVEANVNVLFPHVKTILLAVIGIAALIWIGRKLKGVAFGRG